MRPCRYKSQLELFFFYLNLDPVREYRFHPKRRWRFDYALPDKKIAFEYEGLFSQKSRHTTMTGFINDCNKYNEAQLMGWKILRFTAKHIQTGTAYEMIKKAVNEADRA